MNRKQALLGATAAVALIAICHPAAAQSADQTPDRTTVEEIVVTANKREERLQDVPTAVTVVGGDQLARQNVTEVADITRAAPALNTAGPFGALSMRGIGSISFSRTSESSVGVVVDNVALAGGSATPPALFDIARVEVLSGPQGTLFGRNSSGGVLNIVTNAPNPAKFEAIAHADVGSRENLVARGVVNIPLSETAALRVSGAYSAAPRQHENMLSGDWNQQIGKSARARLLWEPTSGIAVNIIGDYTEFARDGGGPWSVYHATPGSALSQRLAACGVVVGQSNNQACIDGGNKGANETYGVSGQVDFAMGDYTLTSITAARAIRLSSDAYDADSTQAFRLNQTGPSNTDNFSQELRLTSPAGGRVEYVVGAYYFDSSYDGFTTQRGPLLTDLGMPFIVGQTLTTTAHTASLALFGQSTFNVTDDFRLVAGLRYGSEKVKARTVGKLVPSAVAPIASIAGAQGSISDEYLSWRVGAQYDFTDDLMAYLTFAEGYKGPAINDQASGVNVPVLVQPEVPKTTELGLKSTLFDGRLGANLAIFYTKVDDFQAQFFDPSISAYVFGNAPELTSKGFTLDLFGRPMQGLTVNAGVAYTDAKYGDGYVVACSQLQTAAQGCQNIVVGGAVVGKGDDAGGNRLVGTPEWKITSSVEYERDIASAANGFIQIDAVYTSKVNWDAAYNPIAVNAPATIVGGRIGVRTLDRRHGASIFVRNLFDTYRPVARFATPTAGQQLDPQSYSQIAGPESSRVVGISLDTKF